jgi:DNA-binding MarR family transcriptional regulator
MAAQTPDPHLLDVMDLGLLSESIGPAIRLLRNVLSSRILQAFEPYGMRSGTFSTMALIAANPGCSQSEIARQIGTDKSIVVAIVDDLERKGYAERHRSTEDRRRNALTLTAKGEETMQTLNRIGRDIEQPIRDALSPAEFTKFISLARRSVDALLAADVD